MFHTWLGLFHSKYLWNSTICHHLFFLQLRFLSQACPSSHCRNCTCDTLWHAQDHQLSAENWELVASNTSIFLDFSIIPSFSFSGHSNSGSDRRTPRGSRDSAHPPPVQFPIGLDYVTADLAVNSEIHHAQNTLASLRSQITNAEAQLSEYGQRMEGLGKFFLSFLLILSIFWAFFLHIFTE